ncbi:hypothetical protein ABZ413_04310 [Nocardia rhamnosiphila]|uniref:hypothetical protein n=1 Tax=Nocardia rhamnosiphila TaxID=426716 RepID=UPI0033D5991B
MRTSLPIPGTRHPGYVRENAGAVTVELSAEQTTRLEKPADRVALHRSLQPQNLGTEAPAPA